VRVEECSHSWNICFREERALIKQILDLWIGIVEVVRNGEFPFGAPENRVFGSISMRMSRATGVPALAMMTSSQGNTL